LFVLPNLEPGGAERLVTVLLQRLPRDRLDLHLALVARYGLLLDSIPDDVHVHHLRAGRVRRVAYPLLRLAWRLRPDVVLSTLGYMNLALIPLWPFLPRGSRLFVREANTLSAEVQTYPRPGLWTAGYRALYPRADAIVCPAKAMADDLIQNFGIPASSIRHVPNPVDLERIRALANEESPFRGPGPHVLGTGRLAPQKGFDLMIDAFAKLRARLGSGQLWVLGEGSERDHLEARAAERGVADTVHLIGHVPNPYPWMRHADVFVLSSQFEGLPNVVLEAIACETRVAAFDSPGGAREILEQLGEEEELVPPGDVDALAEGMQRLIERSGSPPPLPEEYHLSSVVNAYTELFCEAPERGAS
jgi:glycosyltransferase involved in cell wall biosynthesis